MTSIGYAGQPRPHPLLGSLRAERLLLERLVAGLHLPDDTREVGMTPASRHAQTAAQPAGDERKEADHGDTARSAFNPNAG